MGYCNLRIWLFSKSAKALFNKEVGVPLDKLACLRVPCLFIKEYIRRMLENSQYKIYNQTTTVQRVFAKHQQTGIVLTAKSGTASHRGKWLSLKEKACEKKKKKIISPCLKAGAIMYII